MVPLKQNIEAIISASTMKTASIFTIITETGIEGADLHNINHQDIDIEQRIITQP